MNDQRLSDARVRTEDQLIDSSPQKKKPADITFVALPSTPIEAPGESLEGVKLRLPNWHALTTVE